MATVKTEKLICDRCGSVIRETASIYRCKWLLRVEKRSLVCFATAKYENATSRSYDLCKECTLELEAFVMEKGAKPGVGQPEDYR